MQCAVQCGAQLAMRLPVAPGAHSAKQEVAQQQCSGRQLLCTILTDSAAHLRRDGIVLPPQRRRPDLQAGVRQQHPQQAAPPPRQRRHHRQLLRQLQRRQRRQRSLRGCVRQRADPLDPRVQGEGHVCSVPEAGRGDSDDNRVREEGL